MDGRGRGRRSVRDKGRGRGGDRDRGNEAGEASSSQAATQNPSFVGQDQESQLRNSLHHFNQQAPRRSQRAPSPPRPPPRTSSSQAALTQNPSFVGQEESQLRNSWHHSNYQQAPRRSQRAPSPPRPPPAPRLPQGARPPPRRSPRFNSQPSSSAPPPHSVQMESVAATRAVQLQPQRQDALQRRERNLAVGSQQSSSSGRSDSSGTSRRKPVNLQQGRSKSHRKTKTISSLYKDPVHQQGSSQRLAQNQGLPQQAPYPNSALVNSNQLSTGAQDSFNYNLADHPSSSSARARPMPGLIGEQPSQQIQPSSPYPNSELDNNNQLLSSSQHSSDFNLADNPSSSSARAHLIPGVIGGQPSSPYPNSELANNNQLSTGSQASFNFNLADHPSSSFPTAHSMPGLMGGQPSQQVQPSFPDLDLTLANINQLWTDSQDNFNLADHPSSSSARARPMPGLIGEQPSQQIQPSFPYPNSELANNNQLWTGSQNGINFNLADHPSSSFPTAHPMPGLIGGQPLQQVQPSIPDLDLALVNNQREPASSLPLPDTGAVAPPESELDTSSPETGSPSQYLNLTDSPQNFASADAQSSHQSWDPNEGQVQPFPQMREVQDVSSTGIHGSTPGIGDPAINPLSQMNSPSENEKQVTSSPRVRDHSEHS